jgi:hypothetical protein
MMTPAKRRRALLERNPLRNNRRELIAWPGREFNHKDFRPADSASHAIDSLIP